MAQLAERLVLIPEVHGSNSVIAEFLSDNVFTVNCIEKMKQRKKEAGNGPLKKSLTRT